ncbi:citrate transporter [Lachnospiraceae bacterium AM48-27BH]|nr:citrate transporter [Lachnospiraceae bacterium AM48-27BH]
MLVRKIVNFAKKETVLFAAVLLAFGSMVCVPPDMQYLSYIDYRVLALLFCLMTVMEGFKSTGFFAAVAGKLLEKVKTFRQLYLVLVFLCFFTSMWITNDVALLTFVPFTVLVLRMTGLEQEMIPVIVLQTIAANLGSMTTPVGNPQNLYLYSISGMGIGAFLQIMGPLTLISAGLIFLICLIHKDFPIRQGMLGKEIVGVRKAGENQVLAVLFFISLLSVFRILSWQLLLLIVLVSCIGIKAFCKEKYLPLEADFGLLLTFVAFFIFIGNMGRICAVREVLSQVLNGRELLISFLCSQMISNVPAAILLSGFTQEYRGLLQGVNIGGLGTLIASLASLISYKFFAAESEQTPAAGTRGRYMLTFTIWNVGMALVLLAAAFLLNGLT